MQELYLFSSQKLRVVIGVFFIALAVTLLFFMISVFRSGGLASVSAKSGTHSSSITASASYDNPNIVAIGAGDMAKSVGRGIMAAERVGSQVIEACIGAAVYAGKAGLWIVVQSGKLVLKGVYGGLTLFANMVGAIIGTIGYITGKAIGVIASAPIMHSAIKPADDASLPTIDTQLARLYPAQPVTNVQAASSPAPAPIEPSTTRWPIGGRVTAGFGVPHLPYQKTHTGIDISSGQRSGTTPIYSFKHGFVADVIYSRYGLGNHLVVDHGGGLTSVYAHLHSIAVQKGQEVFTTTVLGQEGSTGMSTGPHLHFEIRMHGQIVDPRTYIANTL